MPEYKQTIKQNLDGDGFISENDQKIDTTDVSDEEKAEQDKATDEMDKTSTDDDTADTSSDKSDEEESDEDDTSEDEESDEDSDDESDKDESDEESDEGESDKTGDETQKGKFNGFDTLDEYKENAIKEHEEAKTAEKDVGYKKIEDSDLSTAEKQKQIFVKFCDDNSDILTASVKENYLKFYTSGEKTFLHIDNSLHKLTEAINKLDKTIPFAERLKMAMPLAFSDIIAKREQAKGVAKAEIRTQKVNKAVGNSTGSSNKSAKPQYSKDQHKAAEKMGVKL